MKNKKDIFRPIILNFYNSRVRRGKERKIENRRQSKPWGTDDMRLLNCDFGYMENSKSKSQTLLEMCSPK